MKLFKPKISPVKTSVNYSNATSELFGCVLDNMTVYAGETMCPLV